MAVNKAVDQSGLKNQLANQSNAKFDNFNAVIKKELAENFNAIKSLVPKHMTPERLARITLTAISRTPKLAECTPVSIVGAVMNCATLGLEPNLIGHAYLVPYWNGKNRTMECQFQVGYKGLLDLIRRTGDVSKIYAEDVYENDLFVYVKGEDKRMIHISFDMLHLMDGFKPKQDSFFDIMVWQAYIRIKDKAPKDAGKVVRYYSAYKLKDGAFDFVTMTEEQCLDHAKKFSKAVNDKGEFTGPWRDHKPAMCKKTCIKEMAKMMPISIEIQEKIAMDEAVLKPHKDTNGIETDSIFDVEYKVVRESDEPQQEQEGSGQDEMELN